MSLLPPSDPPPAGSVAPQGGFLTDLTGINLSDWATLIQDMVASLQALPPSLSNSLGLQVVNLLQLLEAATGVGFCCFCCHPEPHCRCMGVSQSAPPTPWSQILEQTPGYGVTASSGGAPHRLRRRRKKEDFDVRIGKVVKSQTQRQNQAVFIVKMYCY